MSIDFRHIGNLMDVTAPSPKGEGAVTNFIKDPALIALWSKDFFKQIVQRIKI